MENGDVRPKHAPPFASKSESIWMNGIVPWAERGHAFTLTQKKSFISHKNLNVHVEFSPSPLQPDARGRWPIFFSDNSNSRNFRNNFDNWTPGGGGGGRFSSRTTLLLRTILSSLDAALDVGGGGRFSSRTTFFNWMRKRENTHKLLYSTQLHTFWAFALSFDEVIVTTFKGLLKCYNSR